LGGAPAGRGSVTVDACADLVRRADPDRYRSVLAAPVAARGRLLVLYAFNVEVARAPWVSAEPMIGEMRLQFWADVLAGIAAGAPPRRHEVAEPLASAVRAHGIDTAPLADLVAARRRDLAAVPFDDAAALWAYLDATGGGLMWAAAQALGAGAAAESAARGVGRAAGLAGYFRAIPALEAAGKRPLPDGRPEAVQALAQAGLDRLARARRARATVPRAAAPALLAGWRAGITLGRAARAPGRVAAGLLVESEARRRAGLAWRAAFGRW
jgi:phytoene synthase